MTGGVDCGRLWGAAMTGGADQGRLRASFNEDATRYDRARPHYPQRLFDDLAAATGLGPGSRVLEIGPGTGQATVPIARLGADIVAVEFGARMAEVTRRNLAGYPSAEVIVSTFEDWAAPLGYFDLVFSATAFHWVDPAVRMVKAADILRPGGVLATVTTHHVAGGTAEFFVAGQDCYERYDPETPPGFRQPAAADVPLDDAEVVASGRFGPATFHRYEQDVPYTTEQYLDLLMTYSNHRTLPPDDRRNLLDCVGGLIDRRFGGRIVKHYLWELRLAERLA